LLRPGSGPNGETIVFDSEDAVTLFNLRHGRPVETFPPKATIVGPGNLRVPTLGDALVGARPGARVVSVSGKDRASLFMAGRDVSHIAYWYDRSSGRFVTSPAYDTSSGASRLGRALVDTFNANKAGGTLPGRFGLWWKRLALASSLPKVLPMPFPGLADYQLPATGLGFDHDLTRPPAGYFDGIYYSPYVDELVADLALEFLDDPKLALGRGPGSDLLAISFSAQDTVAHSYGAESEEELEVLRRLDLQLGRLFDAFDRNFPKGTVVLGLSADHGFTPIPEAHRGEHLETPGGRLVDSERTTPNYLGRLNRLLSEDLCLPAGSRPIFGSDGWSMMYNRPAFPMRSVAGPCGAAERLVTTKDLDVALPRVALRFFGEELRGVYPIALRDTWRQDDELVEFLRNDLDLERSGDAFLVPKPYVLMHWDPARGSGHGSTYEYDTHVPLIFWGGPFRPGHSLEPTTPYDLAPTLGDLLGVTLKDAVGHSRAPK
jgi:Type I phosphodiesterase / nucleotide pyrophosphatase